jgi:ribosomal protein L20A (L18A)
MSHQSLQIFFIKLKILETQWEMKEGQEIEIPVLSYRQDKAIEMVYEQCGGSHLPYFEIIGIRNVHVEYPYKIVMSKKLEKSIYE